MKYLFLFPFFKLFPLIWWTYPLSWILRSMKEYLGPSEKRSHWNLIFFWLGIIQVWRISCEIIQWFWNLIVIKGEWWRMVIHHCGQGYYVHVHVNIIKEAALAPLTSTETIVQDNLWVEPAAFISLLICRPRDLFVLFIFICLFIFIFRPRDLESESWAAYLYLFLSFLSPAYLKQLNVLDVMF